MRLAVLFLLTLKASAAVLQGIVLDEDTGNPLGRTSVTLTPLTGNNASVLTIRANERGSFTMLSVRAGWYILKTTRKGYADAEAGQFRAGRPGTPFEVLPDTQSTFFQIRMKRLAAVTGTLLDENSVGLPDLPVHVYTATKPVRRVAEGITDDRGIFRVGGLEAGRYMVRSGPGQLEDASGVVPTYYKFGTTLETAEPITLRLGETAQDVVIRPQNGRLFSISGILTAPGTARLTLITDTGRRLVTGAAGPFETSNIPPGPVELVAEGTGCGSYSKFIVDRDMRDLRIPCNTLYRPTVDFLTDRGKASTTYPILARRVDLDGASTVRIFNPTDFILPGHYELTVRTAAKHYTQSMRVTFGMSPVTTDDGWFGMDFGNQVRLAITLADTPATIAGQVTVSRQPVAGAVVYLEWFNPDAREQRLQLFTARSDHTGRYSFTGLPPGRYRLLSGFDFDPKDPNGMRDAKVVRVQDSETAVADLEMQVR